MTDLRVPRRPGLLNPSPSGSKTTYASAPLGAARPLLLFSETSLMRHRQSVLAPANAPANAAARLSGLSAVSFACLLAACGGGSSGVTPPAATLSGTVAVGAPITNGKLRVLDATGSVVVADVAIDADGNYANITLTGPAPYRIEACGYAGPNYKCIYSVANGAGTANVTPLTTATVLLAAGQSPDALMNGAAPALTSTSIASAQTQLREGLASVLSSAGVSGTFDFISGSLSAGSRTGYDAVLDAVGVSTGQDAQPFVQITPRLGSGNLYLEQGSSSGTVIAAAGAATLQLSGLETLFRDMSTSMASATACASSSIGLGRSLAAAAQLSIGGPPAQGPAQVAGALCGFFAIGDDGNSPMWGSRLLSPTLGRCDLSGVAPVCGVSFVVQSPAGHVMPVGNGMGVTQEAGVWKFLGDLLPISIQASARAQRSRRIDTPTPVFDYGRALAFEVAAVPGLACAKVSQRNAGGSAVTIGFFKPHPGATDQQSLALWTADGVSWGAGMNPLVGATRSADDTWIPLPQGTDGDAVVRNFYRGGRSVTVSLFSNPGCSTAFSIGGKSEFEVDVEGVPPVWAEIANLPWPELDNSSQAALRSLAIAGGGSGSLLASWSYPRAPLGLDSATVCGSLAECGQGGNGRIGEKSLSPSSRGATVTLQNRGSSIGADDPKTLALFGRSGDGVGLQSNYSSCPAVVAANESCR